MAKKLLPSLGLIKPNVGSGLYQVLRVTRHSIKPIATCTKRTLIKMAIIMVASDVDQKLEVSKAHKVLPEPEDWGVY